MSADHYAGERPEDAAKRFAGIRAAHTIDGLEAIRQQWAAAERDLAAARERIAALEAEREQWREVACRFLDACAGTYNPAIAEQAAEMFDELKEAAERDCKVTDETIDRWRAELASTVAALARMKKP